MMAVSGLILKQQLLEYLKAELDENGRRWQNGYYMGERGALLKIEDDIKSGKFDAPELAQKLRQMYNQYVGSWDSKHRGIAMGIKMAAEVFGIDLKEEGPEPRIKPGDAVRHRKTSYLVLGTVQEIAKSGLRAYVEWKKKDNPRLAWNLRAYYRLDLLEKVPVEATEADAR